MGLHITGDAAFEERVVPVCRCVDLIGRVLFGQVVVGGYLKVAFEEENGRYESIVLAGPAKQVFTGQIDLAKLT